jgi:hypothetical protein
MKNRFKVANWRDDCPMALFLGQKGNFGRNGLSIKPCYDKIPHDGATRISRRNWIGLRPKKAGAGIHKCAVKGRGMTETVSEGVRVFTPQ